MLPLEPRCVRNTAEALVVQRVPARSWAFAALLALLGVASSVAIAASAREPRRSAAPEGAVFCAFAALALAIALGVSVERASFDAAAQELRITRVSTWAVVLRGSERAHATAKQARVYALADIDAIVIEAEKGNPYATRHAFRIILRTRGLRRVPLTREFWPGLAAHKLLVERILARLPAAVTDPVELDAIATLMDQDDV
ncbi:hypothetical protein KFE25_000183 [Diacronema lutheri]|uniref:Uncharacterized protein n=1 Tax=Diacronema lutheri TaxID=2081491 RepID=A0A8J6CBT0_DIALT|nr:hypothetical protein KFE25_000183 [Diacronema lutheri]